jgi:hypothetical protein
MDNILTETRFLKHEFTDKELLDISRKMARASAEINEKLDQLKSAQTSIKADIATKEGVVNSCAEKIRSGYEMRPVDCVITYEKEDIIFTNPNDGEIVEKRPMAKDEQLRLSGKSVDAEKVIRDDSEKLVDEDGNAVDTGDD